MALGGGDRPVAVIVEGSRPMSRITHRLRARRVALGALVIAVLATACVPRAGAPAPPSSAGSGVVGDIVNRHNSARAGSGLPAFAHDGGMDGRAQFHADRLAGSGGGCPVWHSSQGELLSWYGTGAENVACVGGGGAQVMGMWLNSPAHAVNIVNPAYHFIGVGVNCSGGRMLAVVHFRA